jgi:hypothetical protein
VVPTTTTTVPEECKVSLKVEEIEKIMVAATGEMVEPTGGDIFLVPVSMVNPTDEVLAIEAVLLDEGDGLTCDLCMPDPNRAPNFNCYAAEQNDGSCKIIMVKWNEPLTPIAMAETFEPVFNVKYRVKCGDPKVLSEEMSHVVTTTTILPCDPPEGCIEVGISRDDTIIVDPSYAGLEPICVEPPVQLCFNPCGDVWPGATCGNGIVNLFDILEEIDFALGIEEPSACQAAQGKVPTGTPPDCVAPDDEINVFDVLVIIDKSLDKPNCCDAYNLED